MADLLARFEPVPPAIDRDWLMFQAGQAYALARLQAGHVAAPRSRETKAHSDMVFLPEHQIAPGGKRAGPWGGWSTRLWPAASGLWASVATLLLAVLLVRRELAPPPSSAPDVPPTAVVATAGPGAGEASASRQAEASVGIGARPEVGVLPVVAEVRSSEPQVVGPALPVQGTDPVAELCAAWPLYARMLPGSLEADTLAVTRVEEPASSASAAALPERRSDTLGKPPLTPTSLWRTQQMQELGLPAHSPATKEAARAAWWLPILWNRGAQGI